MNTIIPTKEEEEQRVQQEQWKELNPEKPRSRMDSEDDLPVGSGTTGGGAEEGLLAVNQQQKHPEEEEVTTHDWCIMDIPQDDMGAEKPKRKMTSNSEGTSITAASSFYDEERDATAAANQDKPLNGAALDKLPEADSEEGCDDDLLSEGEEKEVMVDGCCWKWSKRVVGFWIIFGLLGLLIVLIGAAIEKREFYEAEDTKTLYSTQDVCGIDTLVANDGNSHNNNHSNSTTYASALEAHTDGDMVAHCGHCGSCSTAHDLEIMARTTDSLTSDSARCAFKIFIGRKAVEKCMEDRIGFTPDCEDCWLDNIQCSFRTCKFTCIKWKLFRQGNNNGIGLNDCLKCDERMCGPQFIECSGSNRRRMGIVSDIGRDAENEQCAEVDVDWLGLYGS